MTMLKHRFFAATSVAGLAALWLTGCAQSSAQQPRTPAPNEVVATVGSTSITLAQVDEKALQQPTANFGAMKLAQALFEARRLAIDELIDEYLFWYEEWSSLDALMPGSDNDGDTKGIRNDEKEVMEDMLHHAIAQARIRREIVEERLWEKEQFNFMFSKRQ